MPIPLADFLQKLGTSAASAAGRCDPYIPRVLKSKWTLAAVCLLALALRMAVAIFFPGYEHGDEVYQGLEQAHRLAFGNGIIPWEFDEGVRSYVMPGTLAAIFRLAEWVRPGSYLLAGRLAMSLWALIPVCFAWGILRSFVSPRAALIGAFLSAVWFELVYFGPKAHSEVIAAHMMMLGTYLVFPYFEGLRPARLVVGGLLLGLSFCLRIQMALVMAVLWLAMMIVNGRRRVIYATLGAVLGALVAGYVDYRTLAYPYASIFSYYKVNITDGFSTQFGASPWHFILLNFARVWSGALVLFLWFGVEGLRKSRPMQLVFAMALGLIVAHSVVAHKEYRYVYPALPLLLIPIAAGIDRVMARLYPRNSATLAATLAGIAALSLIVGSGGNFRSHFWRRYAETKAYDRIRESPDACGVELHLVKWGEAPGYTHLHRNLPIYPTFTEPDFVRLQGSANYLLSRLPAEPGYTQLQEWTQDENPLYLYRRDGGCSDRYLDERMTVDRRALWDADHNLRKPADLVQPVAK